MTENHDDKTLAYLWDPTAPEDPGVRAVEQQLASLRFEPTGRPLKLGALGRRRPMMRLGWTVAAAAAILMATGVGFSQWRFTWPAGRAWTVSGPSSSTLSQLEVGSTLSVPLSEQAMVDVARIGTMRVEGGSSVTLRSTQGRRHRLKMDNGRVQIRVWAPPGAVAIQTPAGEVIDLGCEFDLIVDSNISRVRVQSGWVQMENRVGEVLIPAGASSEMRPDFLPGVPVFDSAPAVFREAVRQLERGADEAAHRAVLEAARVEDVLTLLVLADRQVFGREQLVIRAAELSPPPGDVTVGRVVRGDRDALWRWYDSLPLPSPKGWLANWRDGLPRWLAGERPRP